MRFVHDTLPQRVCFGSGEAATHLATEIANLKATRRDVVVGRQWIGHANWAISDDPQAQRSTVQS
jgi:hypothetical protein